MQEAIKRGLNFGLTSGVITTLGLMIGLYSGTHSKMVVIAGVLTIAVADSFSDALGIHVSEESISGNNKKRIWASTISTFLSKLVFTLTFVVPIFIFDLRQALLVDFIWGFVILSVASYKIAKEQKSKPINVISEHIFIAIVVILASHYLGRYINLYIK